MMEELKPLLNLQIRDTYNTINIYSPNDPNEISDMHKDIYFISEDKSILVKWKDIIQINQEILFPLFEYLEDQGHIKLD